MSHWDSPLWFFRNEKRWKWTETLSVFIWQCVKTLYPFCSHQNSWDLWMFIPLKMVFSEVLIHSHLCFFGIDHSIQFRRTQTVIPAFCSPTTIQKNTRLPGMAAQSLAQSATDVGRIPLPHRKTGHPMLMLAMPWPWMACSSSNRRPTVLRKPKWQVLVHRNCWDKNGNLPPEPCSVKACDLAEEMPLLKPATVWPWCRSKWWNLALFGFIYGPQNGMLRSIYIPLVAASSCGNGNSSLYSSQETS